MEVGRHVGCLEAGRGLGGGQQRGLQQCFGAPKGVFVCGWVCGLTPPPTSWKIVPGAPWSSAALFLWILPLPTLQLLRLADRDAHVRRVSREVGISEEEFKELPRHLRMAGLSGWFAVGGILLGASRRRCMQHALCAYLPTCALRRPAL